MYVFFECGDESCYAPTFIFGGELFDFCGLKCGDDFWFQVWQVNGVTFLPPSLEIRRTTGPERVGSSLSLGRTAKLSAMLT